MNRIVRENYPVSKLPEDLREGLRAGDEVRVTIDVPADGANAARSLGRAKLETLFDMGRPTFQTIADVDAHLRALREEWD